MNVNRRRRRAEGCAGEFRRPNAATETAAHASVGRERYLWPAGLEKRASDVAKALPATGLHRDSQSNTLRFLLYCRLPRCVVTGAIRIFLQRPKEEVRLTPGETYSVPPKRPHLVTNAGDTSAVFLVLQGIGDYDFVPLADTRTGERGRQKPGR